MKFETSHISKQSDLIDQELKGKYAGIIVYTLGRAKAKTKVEWLPGYIFYKNVEEIADYKPEEEEKAQLALVKSLLGLSAPEIIAGEGFIGGFFIEDGKFKFNSKVLNPHGPWSDKHNQMSGLEAKLIEGSIRIFAGNGERTIRVKEAVDHKTAAQLEAEAKEQARYASGIQIKARLFETETIQMFLYPESKIEEILTYVAEREGVPAHWQKTTIAGTVLDPQKTLADYQIGKGALFEVGLLEEPTEAFGDGTSGNIIISIRLFEFETRKLDVMAENTLLEVKQRIVALEGIPIELQ